VNNSPFRPQPYTSVNMHVDNRGASSTACGRLTPPLTWAFADSSTIHTPYYDYNSYYITKTEEGKGTTCAYPS